MSDLSPVSFRVPGEPQGKGRPRIGKVGQHSRMFTPQKTVAYEGVVALAAQTVMQGRELLQGAVMVEMRIIVSIPQSMSKKRKAMALAGDIFPIKKPDVDNVEKAIFDAINGVVWKDDVQVVDVFKRKRYGETPGVHVRIVQLQEAA
ncbi:RusA family crossover junction endodeoxyribonuclease [Pseudomonas sp. DG56-2]|uniref:RusA family crossover junction endodeoxyribonuclease n=1 Tax=Pseudomonas sp. DG56-2 TaxID=2320270 RepID=UPI0010A6AFE3|nr:RusA family crossover junction endodeoxyribonuclease [Pseudomonas sp. DG56-2]